MKIPLPSSSQMRDSLVMHITIIITVFLVILRWCRPEPDSGVSKVLQRPFRSLGSKCFAPNKVEMAALKKKSDSNFEAPLVPLSSLPSYLQLLHPSSTAKSALNFCFESAQISCQIAVRYHHHQFNAGRKWLLYCRSISSSAAVVAYTTFYLWGVTSAAGNLPAVWQG